mmetsp:Transcript_18684/g.44492  ORF Transcript_18684/g.44492 Transcript_18684/m.44492 type:complete len:327 (+) Transcript_18684:190-1170(+)
MLCSDKNLDASSFAGSCVAQALRDVPDQNRALVADRHDVALVRRHHHLGNRPRVADADGLRLALVVVPELDHLVAAAADEELAAAGDVERVDFGARGAVDDADRGAVVRVPVGDLAVGAGGEELRLVGVVEHGLEEGGREERVVAHEAPHVPDDAAPVRARRHKLHVVAPHLDAVHRRLVLLHAPQHHPALRRHPPHPHRPVEPARHESLGVVGACDRRHAPDMRVVDHVQQLPRLRSKRSDLPVAPPAQDRPPVPREADAVAVQVWNLDAEKLGAGARVPDADVLLRRRGKELRVAGGIDHVVDLGAVAGRAKLRGQPLVLDHKG